MRELQFRAWDKQKRQMFRVVNLTLDAQFDDGIGWVEAYPFDEYYQSENHSLPRHLKLGHGTEEGMVSVMQYTGLKDKNEKDIYEGDIIRILYTDWPSQPAEKNGHYVMTLEEYKDSISKIGYVEYSSPEFVLIIESKWKDEITRHQYSLLGGKHGQKTVIGNIYENPELVDK